MFNISFLNNIIFFFNQINIIFLFIWSVSAICFSFFIIGAKNPMHSIFALIITFSIVIIIMIGYLNCEFLPIIFLIVYVGAVSILFLFIVMLLNIKNIDMVDKFFNYFPVGIALGFLFLIELYLYIYWGFTIEFSSFKSNVQSYIYLNKIDSFMDIEIIAQILYEEYALAFILAALVLLVAMVGAIILTLRGSIKVKRQSITLQVYRVFKLKNKNNF